MATNSIPTITFWSHGGKQRNDPALRKPQAQPARMSFSPKGRFYAGRMRVPADGTLVLSLWSPRPVRIWIGGTPVVDEGLHWRAYERDVRGGVVLPCSAGMADLLIEVGPRSTWHEGIDRDCPSRHRERVRSELRRRLPDQLVLEGRVEPGIRAPAVSLRFLPAQFRRDGIAWRRSASSAN